MRTFGVRLTAHAFQAPVRRGRLIGAKAASCAAALILAGCPQATSDPVFTDGGSTSPDAGTVQPCPEGFDEVVGAAQCARWRVLDSSPPEAYGSSWAQWPPLADDDSAALVLQDYAQVWKFDLTTDQWTGPVAKATDRRSRLHSFRSASIIDFESAGHPIVQTADACSRRTTLLDVSTLSWSELDPVPFTFPPGRFSASLRLGNTLYVHGGQNPCSIAADGSRIYLDREGEPVPAPHASATTHAFSLNTTTLEWQEELPSPVGFAGHSFVRTPSGRYLFASGGLQGTEVEPHLGVVDATSLEWLTVAPVPADCLAETTHAVTLHDDSLLVGTECEAKGGLFRVSLPALALEPFVPPAWADFSLARFSFTNVDLSVDWVLVLPSFPTPPDSPPVGSVPPPVIINKQNEQAFTLPHLPESVAPDPASFRGFHTASVGGMAVLWDINAIDPRVLFLDVRPMLSTN